MTKKTGEVLSEVSSRYNGVEIEKEILEFWDEGDIFHRSVSQNKGGPRFSFNEGPPTANGKPGVHHILARTFKDIYPRYKTMQGFYAPRKAGWDTHGLPVEREIEKKLNISHKEEIEQQVGVAEFTRLCRESVYEYINDWEYMTRRMGYWVDFKTAYFTLDNKYIESVWNLLQRIWNKGLIYHHYKVVPYDPQQGTTLSSHEVAQGYKDVSDPSVTAKFHLEGDDNVSFLVWTTTPWTLPTNSLLAVGKDIEYVYAKTNEEVLILAKSQVAVILADYEYEVIKEVLGHELVGHRYLPLFSYFDIPKELCFRVVAADFVKTEDGTGIVHISPAYGADDLKLATLEGVPVVHSVNLDGCFKKEATPVAGKFFKDADDILISILDDQGFLFSSERITHSYPFGWRSGAPLIYYAKEGWFIKTTSIKDKMVELNNEINWKPDVIKNGRFGNWLENNTDWALSRERFWGTPLPLWSDGEEFVCIGSIAELENLVGRSLSDLDLHRPSIDEITFHKNGKEFKRVKEVIDCWFDSGAMSYAQWHYPFENKDEFDAHFPADYICEAIDQTRGWFYTLHAIGALVDDSLAYKNCVCLSLIVDDQGKKMSKSIGNILEPNSIFDTVGIDSLRWLFLSRTPPETQKRVSIDIVKSVTGSFINTLWNAYAFFILYARLDAVDFNKQVAFSSRPEIDQWMLSLTHATIRDVTQDLDQYRAYEAGQKIEFLVDSLSKWYIRRNRRRFWKSDEGDDKQAAYLTLYESLIIITKLIAPFVPFLSEKIYLNLHQLDDSEADSIHLSKWPKAQSEYLTVECEQLIAEMRIVMKIVEAARSCRESSKVRVRQPLSELLVGTKNNEIILALKKHSSLVCDELNVKKCSWDSSGADWVRYIVSPNFRNIGKKYGRLVPFIKKELTECDSEKMLQDLSSNKVVTLSINGEVIELCEEDIDIKSVAIEGYSTLAVEDFVVALDTNITDDLYKEGLAREVVRAIQETRKTAGLEVEDGILLSIAGGVLVEEVTNTHRDYIMGETLAKSLVTNLLQDGFQTKHQLGEVTWTVSLKKTTV